ncbi:MAG: hypothetical protein HPY55_15745 [Firmicutes bacterium]|nr:hypothetical protein [Bacillota bacterium]
MKDLLKEILGGVYLLRKGALSAAVRVLGTVARWGVDEVGLMHAVVPSERLLNAAAEEQHGSFGEPFGGNTGFFWGGVLGDAAGKVQDFYGSANDCPSDGAASQEGSLSFGSRRCTAGRPV